MALWQLWCCRVASVLHYASGPYDRALALFWPHLCQGATLWIAQRALVVPRTRGLVAVVICAAAQSSCHTHALTMALTALPSDCLLACLARVPYVDLRNTIPSTCKSLRDAVTSAALRKTREAAGWTEWAVFAGRPTIRSDCYIITASGARRTAPRPPRSRKICTARLAVEWPR